MHSWLSWVPALLAAVNSISALPAAPGEAQNVFQAADGSTRTVRAWRFNTTMPGQTQTLMKLARELNADVWSVTPEHIDMRLSGPWNSVPSELDAFPHSPIDVAVPPISSAPLLAPKDSCHRAMTPPTEPWDLTKLTSDFHESYHRFEDIAVFVNELSRTFPHQVELVRVGQSAEGREILAIKIEQPGGKKLRPRIVIQGAQHARDWVAISAALYFAHALVVPDYQPGSYNGLLDFFAFTIIPVPNPDGYAYTWDHDRLWYKNRLPAPEQNGACVGVDMNRNWGFHWDNSIDPCHHWYGGERPFEAPEVSAIAAYIERTAGIKLFVDLRSYGQMLMYPFSYTCDELPPHAEDLIEAALGAAKANKLVHGTPVSTGSACELLYSSPGNVIDWAYAERGITFSYSVFLRDTGIYGFLLPPSYIRPVGEENSALIHYLARWLIKNKL